MKKKTLGTTTITRSFQITLRKIVRDKLDVDVGDIVVFFEENGTIIVEKG